MKTVKEILKTKGNKVWSIASGRTVYEALEMMSSKEIGALLVMDDGEVVGILSERDYARKVILKGASSLKTPVRDIMTTRVAYVTSEETVEDCMVLMTDKRFRHLPVMEGNQVIGVLSIGDLVKEAIADKEFLINQLTNYICGDIVNAA